MREREDNDPWPMVSALRQEVGELRTAVAELQNRAAGAKPGAPLLKVDEALRLLGIGRTKLFFLLKSGEITKIKVGNAVRVERASLDAYLDRERERAENSARGRWELNQGS